MTQNITELYGTRLAALDGDIGHIVDFYFDDQTWVIRYVVAEMGSWLVGRRVLLSPHAFSPDYVATKPLPVNLTRAQIENSPLIDSKLPVSRQYEIKYYHYYGWPKYWEGSWTWGVGSYPVLLPPAAPDPAAPQHEHDQDENHLRSTRAVVGYSVDTFDGTIGELAGFTSDPKSWAIHAAIVKTGHWHSSKEILVSPVQIDAISYREKKLFVNLTKEDIERTGEDQVVQAGSGDLGAKDIRP
jgi:hypothetical protein